MSLINGSIPLGATFAPTGGAATSLVSLGADRAGVRLLIDDGAAFNLRSLIDVSVVEPSVNASSPGGYSAARRKANRLKPKTLADGSTFVNQLQMTLIVHPETTDAEIVELLSTGVNVLNDSDTLPFWQNGSLA